MHTSWTEGNRLQHFAWQATVKHESSLSKLACCLRSHHLCLSQLILILHADSKIVRYAIEEDGIKNIQSK